MEPGGTNESAKVAGELFLDMISEVGNDPDGIIYKTAIKRKGVCVKSVKKKRTTITHCPS